LASHDVLTAFRLAAALIIASPLLVIESGQLAWSSVAAFVAINTIVVALAFRPGEAGHFATVFRPCAIAAAVPAAWMLIQFVPLPISALLHPIWSSAREVLQIHYIGSISIDPGTTFVALTHYSTAVAVVLISAAVNIDRERAQWALIVLTVVTTIIAAFNLVHDFGFRFPATDASLSTNAISSLGVITAAAATLRVIERFETRRSSVEISLAIFHRAFFLSLLALAVCTSAVLFSGQRQVMFAMSCGILTILWVQTVRRIGLGTWFRAASATIVVGIALLIVLSQTGASTVGPYLRYANSTSPDELAIAQRMLSDASWTGSGAGTFAALVPVYSGGEVALGAAGAPTLAAKAIIELGWPALATIILMAILMLVVFVRGALLRGRDSFYVTAAAGLVVTSTLEAFCDASLVNPSVMVIAASLLGLGIAQRASRTIQ
jgi:hypothetical protein